MLKTLDRAVQTIIMAADYGDEILVEEAMEKQRTETEKSSSPDTINIACFLMWLDLAELVLGALKLMLNFLVVSKQFRSGIYVDRNIKNNTEFNTT